MAIQIGSKLNTELADPDYELGRFVDAIPGGSPGTPLTINTHGDIIEMCLRILDRAGRGSGNDLPDNTPNGYELYESLGFWQDGKPPIVLLESDMVTPASSPIAGADVRYNKFCLLGNTLQWHINIRQATILGTQGELYLPMDPYIVSFLGNAFMEDGVGAVTLGHMSSASGPEVIAIQPDIATNALKITRLPGTDFPTPISVVTIQITIPIIPGV